MRHKQSATSRAGVINDDQCRIPAMALCAVAIGIEGGVQGDPGASILNVIVIDATYKEYKMLC